MNFKERGITIGDLLIISIIILTTTFLAKTFNKDKETTFNIINHEQISHNQNLIIKNPFKNFTI